MTDVEVTISHYIEEELLMEYADLSRRSFLLE
jgi:hypothetical protein